MKKEKRTPLAKYRVIRGPIPDYPHIARFICPEEGRIYINTMARPDAKIDMIIPGQVKK